MAALEKSGKTGSRLWCLRILLAVCVLLVARQAALAQGREAAGKPIGKVSVTGNLILMELNEGALGQQNLFDMVQRAIRFAPGAGGYRVENLPLRWDADFGQELSDHQVALHNFAFPFSGKTWNAFSVGVTGSIRFGGPDSGAGFGFGPGPQRDQGGVSIGRFDPLSEAAGNLVNTVPAICVFFKPRMSGKRFVKELSDRVVVTWEVTEPWGNIQDFTWTKTTNRFQAVLHNDGAIELSYEQLAAKDAIVGVYPLVSSAAEKPLASIAEEKKGSAPVALNLDIRNVKLSVVGGLLLKVTLEMAGPVLAEGDAGVSGIGYRVHFAGAGKPSAQPSDAAAAEADWTIRGFAPRNRTATAASRYVAFGDGVSRHPTVSGNTISIQGILPPALRSAAQIDVSAEATPAGSEEAVARISSHPVKLSGLRDPEAHLSSLKPQDGPFSVIYEAFHYYALPNPRDLTCSVIKELGRRWPLPDNGWGSSTLPRV